MEIFRIVSEAARDHQVYVFAPMSLVKRTPERNAMYVFDPDGNQIAEYFKAHPVAGFEKVTPGDTLVKISLPEGLIGLEICHDMDYFQPTKDYSQTGVGLLFVPAADFGVNADGKWHAQVAILQSVTGGMSLARAAYFGVLSGSDSYGRVLSWESTSSENEVLSRVDIPLGSGDTFYARTGNWFAWLNCAIALFFLAYLLDQRC